MIQSLQYAACILAGRNVSALLSNDELVAEFGSLTQALLASWLLVSHISQCSAEYSCSASV
jgi:hypothetical protein